MNRFSLKFFKLVWQLKANTLTASGGISNVCRHVTPVPSEGMQCCFYTKAADSAPGDCEKLDSSRSEWRNKWLNSIMEYYSKRKRKEVASLNAPSSAKEAGPERRQHGDRARSSGCQQVVWEGRAGVTQRFLDRDSSAWHYMSLHICHRCATPTECATPRESPRANCRPGSFDMPTWVHPWSRRCQAVEQYW